MTFTLPERFKESRVRTGFEVRRKDSSSLVSFTGYASVFDHPYEMYGGPDMGGWTERVAKGAFKRSIGIDANRALLYAHDNAQVLATTRSGTLTFAEDSVGLLVTADLDTRVSWVADLVQQVESGVVDEMSVGFYTRLQEWSPDYSERSITEAELVEATIVWAGANPATVATVDRVKQAVTEARSAAVASTLDRVAIAAAAAAARLRA